ncbi:MULTISPECIES: flagella assembly protein FlgT middle domain-containing protein [Alteromonadaceae]|uniref:flagella assembly protein FlgT middle domain-containing protein n=1 Tax=Alteromonadaceae TaxID=72275 RepID=UPI001C07EEDD|nr:MULTISPECIES: flagella assembly protein FlgT middle domain-containing protein [Aliiglaciecola]MBU2878403.1 flagella assembly protein FlgT [Aliiglaciecola lipolytica]MDO6711731.1 flagella assembly protein FlgT middle domain-containing protein [Aliiglaciecola sp. 2_MG-2023]MDO6752802.1 flagella assembly protein FlgT middle domain-containing protein [Aliiglaciecola sp. 1_MG-2023]
MMKMLNCTTLLVLLLLCPRAFAVWQQGEATVKLDGADVSDVRVTAIKNAVADASFKNGSFVSAEDVVLDGLLVSSKSVITTQGQIQRVEVLSESVNEDVFNVIVRVEFSPMFNCPHDGYNRSVLLTQFQVLKPQQASHGGIFDIGKQISKRIEQQLRAEQTSPKVRLIDKAFTGVNSYDQIHLNELTNKAIYMSKEYGRQFVMFGFIRDISLFEQVKEELLSDDVSLRRNFTIQVYVLDVYRHTIIFQESYHSEADWEYSDDYNVDTNNSLFWRSDYGRTVLNTVNGAVSDVANKLQCEQSFAQIVGTNNHKLIINMGLDNGLKLGDKFLLYKKRLPVSANGLSHAALTAVNQGVYKVVQLDSLTAELSNDDPAQVINGDLLDLVSPTR